MSTGELTAEEDDGATAALLGGMRAGYRDAFLASLDPALRTAALEAEDRSWTRYRQATRNTDPDR
ncbi:hypothetical protein [Frankia sp. AvcI1]|uniref:hypothetical protein n=1 Tax=Frankia sp. AvcI1 TaxID=573496 RepID=UPI0021198F82|nr:hypothetical protein [Frankia sp. AvcI1]